jgi:hypothetical protein
MNVLSPPSGGLGGENIKREVLMMIKITIENKTLAPPWGGWGVNEKEFGG